MRLIAFAFLLLAATARAQTCGCPQADMTYETDTRSVSPSSLAVCTQAGCGILNVQVAHRIVTPASITAGVPFADDPHYLAIESNNNSGFPEPGTITLQTSTGAMLTVTPTQPKFFFSPCEKSLVGPPGLPPASVLPFVCSKLKSGISFKVTVDEEDQFGTNNPCVLDKVAYVCQTATVGGLPPPVTSWLVCFSLNKKASHLVDPAVKTFVDADFFGQFIFNSGALHTPDEFCLAATQL